MAGGGLVAVSTVLGFCGRFGWLLDLFAHFRLQYAVLLILVCLVLCAVRRFGAALVFAFFLGLNVAVIAPLYSGGTDGQHDSVLRALLMNVKTDHINIAEVASAIRDYDTDLVLLEEVDAHWLRELQPVLIDYPYSVASPSADSFGIALFSKLPLSDASTPIFGPAKVRSVQASIVWNGRTFNFLGTHPYPPVNSMTSHARDEQLHAIALELVSLPGPVLLMGDLNTTPWSYHFRRLLSVSGLSDCGRGHGLQPTWPTHNIALRIPIDHCLHSAEITIVDKQIGRDVGSDHFPVIVAFTF